MNLCFQTARLLRLLDDKKNPRGFVTSGHDEQIYVHEKINSLNTIYFSVSRDKFRGYHTNTRADCGLLQCDASVINLTWDYSFCHNYFNIKH